VSEDDEKAFEEYYERNRITYPEIYAGGDSIKAICRRAFMAGAEHVKNSDTYKEGSSSKIRKLDEMQDTHGPMDP